MKRVLIFYLLVTVAFSSHKLIRDYQQSSKSKMGVDRKGSETSTSKTLLTAAIRNGLGDKEACKKDIAVLLSWLNSKNPSEVGELVNNSRQEFTASNATEALALLAEIEAKYKQLGDAKFGPVKATSPGVAERMALLVQVSNATGKVGELIKAIDDFSKGSGVSPQTFAVAKQTQTLLGYNDAQGGAFWRDEVIPAILQQDWTNNVFVTAAAGGTLPNEFKNAKDWLNEWLTLRSLKIETKATDVFGFSKPRRTGYRAVAAHPIILHLLHNNILADLASDEKKQFLSWLATIPYSEPEMVFSGGMLVLEAATKNNVAVNTNGELEGDAFWKGLAKQVLDFIVNNNDASAKVVPSWNEKQNKLDQLYLACPLAKSKLLSQPDLGELLHQYAVNKMAAAWSAFNLSCAGRTNVLAIGNADINALSQAARKARSELAEVIGNPLCAPWLPYVINLDRPSSPEAGLLMRWYMTQLRPSQLKLAIDDAWERTALTTNKIASVADKAQAIDNFAAWEVLRGVWLKPGSPIERVPAQLSPWTHFSQSALINHYREQITDWQTNALPNINDARQRSALTALCWFGGGDEPLAVKLKLAASDNATNTVDKAFFLSCRLHLAATNVLQGESMESVINDNQLLDATEITNLDNAVNQLYSDSRPFSLRAATDIAWLICKRVTSIVNQGFTESALTDQPGLEVKNKQLRESCRNILKQLDALLNQSISNVNDKRPQSGLLLALANMEVELYRSIPETGTTTRVTQRRNSLITIINKGIEPGTIGTGFWGMETWLAQWEWNLKAADNGRMFTVQPVKFPQEILRSTINRNLGAYAVMLEGRVPFNNNQSSWATPGSWSNYLHKNDKQIQGDMRVKLSSIPWKPASTPVAMMQLLMDQASMLESKTVITQEPVDVDGLNAKFLPSLTWAGGMQSLQTEADALKAIEQSMRQQYNTLDLQSSISSLKPLLSAPLVVNLSAFRDELLAAVAEVKRAEADFQVKQYESFSAKLEVKAQELLIRVFSLEKQRTDSLIKINENDAKIANLEKKIANLRLQIEDLRNDLARNKDQIAALDIQIGQIEKEKKSIEVGMAASVVATLKNQLQLLQDLIYTPTPNPDFKDDRSKDLNGMLGVIAYEAQKQVQGQLKQLKEKRGELQRQLDDLREASFIKAVCSVMGAIVGCVIGGPAGAQMGAMIGQAVGGLIASVKQGKPLGEILKNTVSSGIQIAAAAGIDLKAEGKSYLANSELGESIANAQRVIGPMLKDLSAIIDRNSLQTALSLPGAEKTLKKFVEETRGNVIASLEKQGVNLANSDLAKSIDKILMYGKPEEIEQKLKEEADKFLQTLPLDETLKKVAIDLGLTVTGATNEAELKSQIAEKMSTLSLVRILPELAEKRSRMVQKMMISLTAVQDIMRKAGTTDLKAILESEAFKRNVPIAEYKEQITWLQNALGKLTLSVNQEIPWSQLSTKVEEALSDMFPNDPERKALLLGQFQAQLDIEGMQAEMQRMLNPWNKELQRRIEQVEKTLNQPCNSDDEEKALDCQISVVDQGVQSLESNVLNWLRDGNSDEVKDLRKQVSDKLAELKKAEDNLKIANLDWKAADIALKKARFLKQNANLETNISKLNTAIASLAIQQSNFLVENKNLEISRSKLQAEKDLFTELSGEERKKSLGALERAAAKNVEGAAAALDVAIAKAKAARNRAIVYGKIEGWYTNSPEENENQTFIDLYRLTQQYTEHVRSAGYVVRDLLRLLRTYKANFSGFALPPANQYWSAYVEDVKKN